MTKIKEIYKCSVCGNIVEILHEGAGELVCCNIPMILEKENTSDSLTEKHLPVIKKVENGYLVSVGETLHPMEDSHYIEWIEVVTEKGACKKFLKPEDKPEMLVCSPIKNARAYCNLHGLWAS